MKFWNWIVQAAKDVWSFVWTLIGFLRDKTGKFSFKRVSGVAAFVIAVDFFFRGAWLEGLVLLGYCAVVAIIAAVTGT
jgi:hypothetical protein